MAAIFWGSDALLGVSWWPIQNLVRQFETKLGVGPTKSNNERNLKTEQPSSKKCPNTRTNFENQMSGYNSGRYLMNSQIPKSKFLKFSESLK